MVDKITYLVEIREVWISTRRVTVVRDTPEHQIIREALDQDDANTNLEFSHTMDSENHVVRELP